MPLYVYDILLTTSSTSLLQKIIKLLVAEFAMTDLSSVSYILSISTTSNKEGLFLSQQKYALEVLEPANI